MRVLNPSFSSIAGISHLFPGTQKVSAMQSPQCITGKLRCRVLEHTKCGTENKLIKKDVVQKYCWETVTKACTWWHFHLNRSRGNKAQVNMKSEAVPERWNRFSLLSHYFYHSNCVLKQDRNSEFKPGVFYKLDFIQLRYALLMEWC